MNLSFENTENAFAHLTDKELKNARFLFQSMSYPWLVQMGTRLTPFIMRTGLPVHGLIRKTLFKQFVGGETLENTEPVTQKLHSFGVEVILDYGVEGKEGEESFDTATEEFMRVIRYASTQTNIPFISIKVTGLARFGLLQSLNEAPRLRSGIHDHEWELDEWDRVRDRMYAICELAAEKKIGVLIDAEESWIQDPVDRLCMEMMQQFNTTEAVVYNTVQLYRHDRLSFLKMSHRIAREKGFVLGVKLVRGAYMEKERARALEKGSDRDFNAAVQFCLENLGDIAVVVASHNENSNQLAAATMDRLGIARNHSRVHFSQLYGMSDHITFNMAREGFRVSKYLPFGPIREVIPYLMRRAQENTSVSGQTGRELTLIQRELQRRKKSNSPVLPTAAE
jgi:proline dehydrogenase